MPSATAATERLHALDAVRAGALLLGVVVHGLVSFVPDLPPELLWPVRDVSQSLWAAALVFVIHVFRMSLFFVVAGLLAHALLHRLGPRAFWRNRGARIGLPLLLGWPVCFALIVAAGLWALSRGVAGPLPPPSEQALQAALSWLHLWFLYLLLWLYAMAWGVRAAVHAVDRHARLVGWLDRALRAALASPLHACGLALPVALALFLEPHWDWRTGVPTPAYTLIPPPVPLFIYAWVFGIGWLLDRQRDLLATLQRGWAQQVLIGTVFTLVCLTLADPAWAPRLSAHAGWRAAYALGYALALMALSLGLLGAGLRFMSRSLPAVRYLADASYWIYIAHLPLVMALQAVLASLPAPWWLKLPVVVLGTCALLLWSYRLWVRPTWVGALLNGARR